MKESPLGIVFLGLSITSSWGNGHATTYRGLVRELSRRGHDVLFLERDAPWYEANRDLPKPPYGRTELYGSVAELKDRFSEEIRRADLVVVGSYVPDGIAVGEWVTRLAAASAFYDIDTPVTLARLRQGRCDYLETPLIGRYDLYLSFTGGPVLEYLEDHLGARKARPLYCSVDPELHCPDPERRPLYDLGYMGTYSRDRQPALESLLLEPARRWQEGRFAVAGPLYPAELRWPPNVERIDHVEPSEHRAFFASQRFTLNLTRADMIEAGFSPSVRIFEAAACGTPIVSDYWPGLETFLVPGEEILISRSGEETLRFLRTVGEEERSEIGRRARARMLAEHTAEIRAREFEGYAREVLDRKGSARSAKPRTLETQLHNPRSTAEQRVAELGPWFHNLHLPDGVQTAPGHPLGDFPAAMWARIAPHLPASLEGWSVLDVGCNAGYYAFELARRGARVTALDCDPHYLRQAAWARAALGLVPQVDLRLMQVYDLAHAPERYDLVLFLGVFYHLRHPLLALDILSEKVKRLLLFQTLTAPGDEITPVEPDYRLEEREVLTRPGWPAMAFIEHRFAGDPTNWWAPNRAAVEALLRSSGFRIRSRIDAEIYLCEPAQESVQSPFGEELRAATGCSSNPVHPVGAEDAQPSEAVL